MIDLRAYIKSLPEPTLGLKGGVSRAAVLVVLPPGDEPVYAVTVSTLTEALRTKAIAEWMILVGGIAVAGQTLAPQFARDMAAAILWEIRG